MIKTIAIPIFLLLSFFPSGIFQAQEAEIVQGSKVSERRIDAFNLVSAAYRGRFEEWGIPSYARLDQAYRGGQITASDLIKAAVEADQLSAIALEDKDYVHAVDTNLYGLVTR